MKKLISMSFALLFLLAALPSMAAPAATAEWLSTPEWKIDANSNLVYNVTKLVYNVSDTTMPVYDYDEGEPTFQGNITEGSELYIQIDYPFLNYTKILA